MNINISETALQMVFDGLEARIKELGMELREAEHSRQLAEDNATFYCRKYTELIELILPEVPLNISADEYHKCVINKIKANFL